TMAMIENTQPAVKAIAPDMVNAVLLLTVAALLADVGEIVPLHRPAIHSDSRIPVFQARSAPCAPPAAGTAVSRQPLIDSLIAILPVTLIRSSKTPYTFIIPPL